MPHSEVNFNDNFDGNSQQQKLLASEFGAKTSSANNDDEIKRIKLDLDEVEEDFTVDSSSTSKMLQTLLQSLSASGTDNFVENFLKAENQCRFLLLMILKAIFIFFKNFKNML